MTTRSVSPGAALLRASRMFSMPAPIPAAPGNYSSATKRHSPTATIPYPTHLSVTTPSSSRVNGDWGFKRPLPLKTTTRTTIPAVRVRQVDSIEHVTDFQSASDHTITLEKFLELHLPVTTPPPSTVDIGLGARPARSAFEEDSDVTAIPKGKEEELENKRWRFKGPWLAGMTDGEFDKYLEKEVRARRTEFRAALKERLAAELTSEQERAAKEKAVDAPEPMSVSHVTDRHLTAYMKRLRNDTIELYQIVGRFLDLAPLSKPVVDVPRMLYEKQYKLRDPSPYSNNGPPITHPSAGISYLRTRHFLENHPVYGPQERHAPVEARIVMPRSMATGQHLPVIGVAGFIAKFAHESTFNSSNHGGSLTEKALVQMDLETSGGAKKFAEVEGAHVDSTGKVIINVCDTTKMAQVIQKEMLGRARVYGEAPDDIEWPEMAFSPKKRPDGFHRRRFADSSSYGMKGSYGRNL